MVLGIPKRTVIIAIALIGAVFLYIIGGGSQGSKESGDESAGRNACTFTVSADVLNVREGPSTEADVVGKYQQQATVSAEPTVRNGFRKLAEKRWVAEEFLDPATDADCA